MKLIVTKDFEAMSTLTASVMLGEFSRDGRVNASITAGTTPLRAYEIMTEVIKSSGGIENIHYYNFDEIPILNSTNQIVAYETLDYLTKVFYGPANIPENQIHHLNQDNYKSFDRDLAFDGGLDLMLIGLGGDGHFCANMPETTRFHYETYKVDLVDDYPWNKPYQDSLGKNHCDIMITMGPRTVMKTKRLIMIVSGTGKAEILKKCIEGEILESVPSSLLKLHSNFTIICDMAAASLLSSETLKECR